VPAPGGTGTLGDLAVADSTLLVPAFGRLPLSGPRVARAGVGPPFVHRLGSDERVVVADAVGPEVDVPPEQLGWPRPVGLACVAGAGRHVLDPRS
jgi:hypothetical protein